MCEVITGGKVDTTVGFAGVVNVRGFDAGLNLFGDKTCVGALATCVWMIVFM